MAHSKDEPKLGKLILDEKIHHRDAIHVAVAPVIAHCEIKPGEHIGFVNRGKNTVGPEYDDSYYKKDSKGKHIRITGIEEEVKPIGIADPYLERIILPGKKFWMLLYPNTVTSLRHEWTHPEFEDMNEIKEAEEILDNINKLGNKEQIEYLTKCAESVKMSYEEFMEHLRTRERIHLGFDTPDEFYNKDEIWKCFEIITGQKVSKKEQEEWYVSCSC